MRITLPRRPFVVPVRGVKAMGVELEWIPTEWERGPILIRLVAEPDNPADANAIRIEGRRPTPDGLSWELLGYVPRDLAARMNASEWEAELEAVLWHEQAPAGVRIRVSPRVEEAARGSE